MRRLLPIYRIRYAWFRFQEKFWMGLTWMLPRKVVYFAVIRVWANATSGQYNDTPDDVSWNLALNRWEERDE